MSSIKVEYLTILDITEKFYEKAKFDILIGYHFRVIDDFDEHIPRIADFWNLQINGVMKERSHLPFDLLAVHIPLKINKGEVFRWEKLFSETLYENKDQLSQEDIDLWLAKVEIFKQKILLLL